MENENQPDYLSLAITLCGIRMRVTDSEIQDWLANGVPEHTAMRLEQLTSGAVTAEQLRPDIFK